MTELPKDIITALTDDEIHDPKLKNEVLSKLETDNDLALDYKMQSLVKDVIKEKITFKKAPYNVKAKILKSIGSNTKIASTNKSFLAELFNKPSFTFATVFVVLLAIVLLIINRPVDIENKDFISEQHGSNNMFVQAQNNFKNILAGSLIPQLLSNNTDEIKSFFGSNGVKYSTFVFDVIDWNLLGAFVSDDKGEKLAHYIYTDNENRIAYLFQVDETYLINREIITLSDNLIKYLNEGNCYTSVTDSSITLFTKIENNICVVISNANPKEVEKNFCNM